MRAYAGLWGTMFGVVLVAVVTSTAMMGPPGRRSHLDAELAEAVADPASVVALVLGVLVVLLPLPPWAVLRCGHGDPRDHRPGPRRRSRRVPRRRGCG